LEVNTQKKTISLTFVGFFVCGMMYRFHMFE